MIEDELKEIFAQVPEGNDQFDFALVPGNPPRLWIDMIAFIMMDRDRRTYRFIRDTSSGRQVIAQSAEPEVIRAKVMDYVAHRIVERERLLAGEPEMPARSPDAMTGTGRIRGYFGVPGLVAAFLFGLMFGALALLFWGFYVVSWPSGAG
jgi:hypothetical protein